MLYGVGFNIKLKDANIKVIKFSKDRNTVSVFNSDNAAGRAGGVYIVNKIASKREVLLVLRNNNIKKYSILGTNI